MLRPLFLLSVTIAFYWPEPVTRRAWRNGFTKCGEEVCRRVAKTGLIRVSLARFIGKLVC
jgi:hypothetical protein